MSLKLVAIGEAMAELRQNDAGGFSVGFAGDTFNTAVYCARSLPGAASVGYLTHIGNDPLSTAFHDLAKSEMLDTSGIVTDPAHNIGIYSVSTDADGERSFHYWRQNSAARHMFRQLDDMARLPKAQIIYLSGITLAILEPDARQRIVQHLVDVSKNLGTLIAFDSNYRPNLWENVETARKVIGSMWEIADIALPSIDDEMALFGDVSENGVIERFEKRNWRACAIKRGSRGPISPRLSPEYHPAFPEVKRVVDTTAAGDSFNGGYLAAMLRGENEETCLVSGHQMAARVVQFPGAIIARDAAGSDDQS